jgi:hypothetical protein
MESEGLSRRVLLRAIAAIVGSAAAPIGWAEVAQAIEQGEAHHERERRDAPATISFLTAAEAADVEAIAAQIIPTDGSPGAREAGAVHFIDRALATFFAQLGRDYRAQLAAFQVACRERYPGVPSFAALASDQQIEFLTSVERTPFFTTTRLLTLLGMFSLPIYGGNRDRIGWTLIGFEDAHVFHPPFGQYDRDYPGFVIDAEKRR